MPEPKGLKNTSVQFHVSTLNLLALNQNFKAKIILDDGS